ncbi:MAG: Uma2 family endonuclease [Planctomycetes bacterium]|nr:Uma2 family endonuclease [Planctomycetota bacterium]
MTASPPVPAERITYEEFLARCSESRIEEWVDGWVVREPGPSDPHMDLAGFLGAVLRAFVEAKGLGIVRIAPFQMKTGPDLPGREPEILFVREAHRNRVRHQFLEGPADLAIEIISPDSRRRDREEKYREYEAGGVEEYWILDPEKKRADFYVRDRRGCYRARKPDPKGIYRSRVLPGFWLEVDGLWQRPLPLVLGTLRRLGIV